MWSFIIVYVGTSVVLFIISSNKMVIREMGKIYGPTEMKFSSIKQKKKSCIWTVNNYYIDYWLNSRLFAWFINHLFYQIRSQTDMSKLLLYTNKQF